MMSAAPNKTPPNRNPPAITRLPLTQLHEHPDNPRTISAARLEDLKRALAADPSMLEVRPLIALPDGTVIASNQRLRAARELGWESIPTAVVDLDDETARLWMLRDNNPYGEWDEAAVAEMLAGIAPVAVALAGFGGSEVDRLLAGIAVERPDADDAPPLPAVPRSKLGEVYELGPHRLMCGDATDPAQVRALFAPPGHHALDLVAAIWTDPPYGVEYVGKTKDALTIEGDQAAGLRELIADALGAVAPGLSPHTPFYVAAPAGPRHRDFLDAIDDVGWRIHQTLVWVKQRMILGHSDYHYQHEPILYGWAAHPEWKGRPGRGAHAGSRWHGGNDQTSVFMIDAPTRSAEHPTMKPVELIRQQVANSTQRGVIVYDPFAGSGSTLIACEEIGRRARLMEIDPGYCDVIRDRYAAFTTNG